MHLDPMMPPLVAMLAIVLAVGLALRAVHQPHVVAYLIAGFAIGPHGFELMADAATAARLGDIGVVLLLFLVGTEISLSELRKMWRAAFVGTILQVAASVLCVGVLGFVLDWPWPRSLLLGFVISLSSTAVVITYLREKDELGTDVGRRALGILLAQDLAIVPMLLTLGMLGDEHNVGEHQLAIGAAVACALFFLLWFVSRQDTIALPMSKRVRNDHELQVFWALLLCFGMATATAAAGLSSALGAFVGGLLVSSARETEWVVDALDSLRVLLVALFFAAIGMLIEPRFILEHLTEVGILVALALVVNTTINALLLRAQKLSWRESLYGGGLLAQIGEFSFILAAVGLSGGIVNQYSYRMTVSVIAVSLAIAPLWIGVTSRFRTHEAMAR